MNVKAAPKLAEPQQKRAIATRAGLLETVEHIVATETIEAVTTTRVAQESGVAVGTIYRYFRDREAMLLAAYDETVARLVRICQAALEELPDDIKLEEAGRQLLDIYLDAAEAIPAHAGLLKAMRQVRPIEAGLSHDGDQIVTELVAPFFFRFAPTVKAAPLRLLIMSAVLGTLVDLYLVTPGKQDRALLRDEIEAHLLLMLARAV